MTRKHKNRTNVDNIEQGFTPSTIFTCKKCNKEYKARTSLWYHEKKCKSTSLVIKKDSEIIVENNN
jgi:Zn finger protein HypA/HybF involved in hydrogenase expression